MRAEVALRAHARTRRAGTRSARRRGARRTRRARRDPRQQGRAALEARARGAEGQALLHRLSRALLVPEGQQRDAAKADHDALKNAKLRGKMTPGHACQCQKAPRSLLLDHRRRMRHGEADHLEARNADERHVASVRSPPATTRGSGEDVAAVASADRYARARRR